MTTYQRKGGQYRTRSGATAYRRGVKGQRAAPTVRRTVRRFYRKHTVPCLVVGGLGLIMAWHAAPLLVLAGAGMLAVPYAVDGVKKAKATHQAGLRRWQAWRQTPVARANRPPALADRFNSRWQAAEFAFAAAGAGLQRFRDAPPGHPYTPGSPPLFLCGTCNEPHRKRAAS